MDKKQLREKYSALRKSISKEEALELSVQISNNVLALPIWDFNFYHIFLPIENKNEVDTSFLLSILQGKDKHIVLPKMNDDKTLTNYLLTDNTLIKSNNFGVPEPVEGIEIDASKIDVVFIPLLAFDKKGNRVGYGKGFSARFLSGCKSTVVKIGLSFFPPEEKIVDVFDNDVPLDYCVTPIKTYKFEN